jgi:hypothetical protein
MSWIQTTPYVHTTATINNTEVKNNELPPIKVKPIPLKLLAHLYKSKNGDVAVHTHELRNVAVKELNHLMKGLPKPASQISSLLEHNLVLATEDEG